MNNLTKARRIAAAAMALMTACAAGITSAQAAPQGDPAPQGEPARYGPGAPGSGDPYFPSAGNGGYDVLH